jgi:hypothetical protein
MRENPDPYLAAALYVAGHGLAGCLYLAGGDAFTFQTN